jgi:hypothetical protein
MDVLINYREIWAVIERRSEKRKSEKRKLEKRKSEKRKSEKRRSEKLPLLQETLKIFQSTFS